MVAESTTDGSPVTGHWPRLWTVVPVRGIAEGKSRLAAALDADARAGLNRQLIAHTLRVVAEWRGDLNHCVVVSSCRETLALAAHLGAAVLDEGTVARGLNAAAAQGTAYAGGHGARQALVLACDLPRLGADALVAMAQAAESERHLVIAPDRGGTGTNALLLDAREPFDFRFGEGSCAKHAALGAERGWRTVLVRRPELEFDLDTPEDLARWMETTAEAGRHRVI
jgi:2-phospho-L-lactate guanylyltransferase